MRAGQRQQRAAASQIEGGHQGMEPLRWGQGRGGGAMEPLGACCCPNGTAPSPGFCCCCCGCPNGGAAICCCC